jgi:hypothetical protein
MIATTIINSMRVKPLFLFMLCPRWMFAATLDRQDPVGRSPQIGRFVPKLTQVS